MDFQTTRRIWNNLRVQALVNVDIPILRVRQRVMPKWGKRYQQTSYKDKYSSHWVFTGACTTLRVWHWQVTAWVGRVIFALVDADVGVSKRLSSTNPYRWLAISTRLRPQRSAMAKFGLPVSGYTSSRWSIFTTFPWHSLGTVDSDIYEQQGFAARTYDPFSTVYIHETDLPLQDVCLTTDDNLAPDIIIPRFWYVLWCEWRRKRKV